VEDLHLRTVNSICYLSGSPNCRRARSIPADYRAGEHVGLRGESCLSNGPRAPMTDLSALTPERGASTQLSRS
jgi:hypothetical protein